MNYIKKRAVCARKNKQNCYIARMFFSAKAKKGGKNLPPFVFILFAEPEGDMSAVNGIIKPGYVWRNRKI